MMDIQTKKNTGSYYTCDAVADYIVKWAIDASDMSVLEPSFGDGIFIDAALARFKAFGKNSPAIIGVEIQEEPFKQFMNVHKNVSGFQMDFMDYRASEKVNAIIGNPPYVSLKKLKAEERERAQRLVSSYGVRMQANASLWMPFVIHATELLQTNGKLGFILPYEITYVRYSFDLWKYLSVNYGKITICRVYHDFFPGVDVETVILLADEKGAFTTDVCYRIYENVTDLLNGKASLITQISIDDIIKQNKPFERELMPTTTIYFLELLRKKGKLMKFVEDCKFKIGYVSGNKTFFHLTSKKMKEFGISPRNIRKCLVNSKQITANSDIGIETKGISNYSHLFYPVEINDGEKKYIEYGEKQGISDGYKCRVRKSWYLIPGLEIPDIILTVFGDVPRLMVNNGDFYVSNSLLSGFAKNANVKELICRWYNSMTLLSIETTIHSLGGGTLVLIPGETDKLEIITDFPSEKVEKTYKMLVDFAKKNSTEDIYKYGDEIVLKEIYGFSERDIREITTAISILRDWRNPEKRRG